MKILLNDKEIKQAVIEADKEIWAYKAHPRWEGEKYLMKVQLKKVADSIESMATDGWWLEDIIRVIREEAE